MAQVIGATSVYDEPEPITYPTIVSGLQANPVNTINSGGAANPVATINGGMSPVYVNTINAAKKRPRPAGQLPDAIRPVWFSAFTDPNAVNRAYAQMVQQTQPVNNAFGMQGMNINDAYRANLWNLPQGGQPTRGMPIRWGEQGAGDPFASMAGYGDRADMGAEDWRGEFADPDSVRKNLLMERWWRGMGTLDSQPEVSAGGGGSGYGRYSSSSYRGGSSYRSPAYDFFFNLLNWRI